MFSTLFTKSAAAKAVAVAATVGALSLGTAGVASAATAATTTPSRHVTCARAPKALARLAKVESAIGTRVTKLQSAEQKLTAAGHTEEAAKVAKRITRLQKVDTRATTLTGRIKARCPSAAAS